MTNSTSKPFWDNLIPLKPAYWGEQYAGWDPKQKAQNNLGCYILADQRVPVDENISLSADVYTPKVKGRYPAIVSYAPYCKELHTAGIPEGTNETGNPATFTNHGYCHIIIAGRGMSRSDGEPVMFYSETQVSDHEKCLAWAAEQPWCDGNVVMFGTSYYGMLQPLVAVRNPPALKAFFCNEICTDYFRHLINFATTSNVYFLSLWAGANFTQGIFDLRMSPFLRALIARLTNSWLKPYWMKIVKKKVNGMFRGFMSNTPIKPVREWIANFLFDAKTRATNCAGNGSTDDLSNINVPFVVVQNLGCFNLHQYGSYDLFENASTPDDKKWMILAEANYDLPVYSWQLEAIAFFNHVLFDADNGYREQAPVRYWLDGKMEFKKATAFPAPESQPIRFYLASGGNDHATHRLVDQAPASQTVNSWEAVPMGAPLLGKMEEVINQTLSYEMSATEEMEFSGAVTAKLNFSCNEIDSYVVARLGRIGIDGEYKLLSMGAISPARRKLEPERNTSCEIAIDTQVPQPLIPGETVPLLFSLTPAPTFLQPGEKLRFEVGSRVDLLKSDVAQGYAHFDMQVPPYFSRNTLHYGDATYLELNFVNL
jgi:putative CocE/NonD family hydrolase